MSASGHSMVGRAAAEAAGGGVAAGDENLMHSPEQAEEAVEAVEAARGMLVAVFERAHRCARRKCRRKGACLAGWGRPGAEPNPVYEPTGGCPVMTKAEWEVVLLGVIFQRMLLGNLLHAMEEAEEDGRMPPSSASQPGRKTVPWPLSWGEWLALDPVGRLRDFEREVAAFAARWE
jgi:hypothetical protein